MENSNNISLLHDSCMKCGETSDLLLSFFTRFSIRFCNHKFCQTCFKKENTDLPLASDLTYEFICPCCHIPLYKGVQSIDEAILIGEAATMITHITTQLTLRAEVVLSEEEIVSINEVNKLAIEKLLAALQLNPANFHTLYTLFYTCGIGYIFLTVHQLKCLSTHFYQLKLIDYSLKLLDHPAIPNQYEYVRTECFYQLAYTFSEYRNYPIALKYAKLTYEHCLRSSDHTQLSSHKSAYIKYRAAFARLPPLRFAVGAEVEFLYELETGIEWKPGTVVELYYWELPFDINFSAPYRIQLLEGSSVEPPVYAWVKADLDRYVRKMGVRSIEDTRYQARLEAKVEELEHIYCSKEFTQDIHRTLAQDRVFVDMVLSVWQVELAETTIKFYRILIMYRQPLLPADSGYHLPSTDEVIAGIRAFFDPAHLSGDAAPSAGGVDGDSPRIRSEILEIFRSIPSDTSESMDISEFSKLLLESIRYYNVSLSRLDSTGSFTRLSDGGRRLTVPPQVSEAICKSSTSNDLRLLRLNCSPSPRVEQFLLAWTSLHLCLEKAKDTPACECPFLYFFVKHCLELHLGVPKRALALYDKMNMQLSREFIRCANPSCELNKLDQSTGQVKFKTCSRCKAVIYCSRECQVAHYPEHKRLCREHSID